MNEARHNSGFYFALPRLFSKWRGRNGARVETDWLELNLAGLLFHLVVYAFAFRFLLFGFASWQKLLLLLPLAFVVWIFWLLLFYFDALCIRVLRALGLMRRLSDSRAQSILIGAVTTCFAFALLSAGGLWQALGIFWLTLVAINLASAAILAFSFSDVSAAE